MWRDPAYLLDMLLAARKAIAFTQGQTAEAFATSELTQYAVVRALEILGEAAGKISATTRHRHPEVPWRELTALRNRLIHEYFRTDVAKVWEFVSAELPGLIASLEPLVPPRDQA